MANIKALKRLNAAMRRRRIEPVNLPLPAPGGGLPFLPGTTREYGRYLIIDEMADITPEIIEKHFPKKETHD